MKPALDLSQILLTSFPGCVLLAVIGLQIARIIWKTYTAARLAFPHLWACVLPVWRFWTAAKVGLLSISAYIVAAPAADAIQWLECKYIAPAYVSDFQGYPADVMQARFEQVLRRNTDGYEFQVFTAGLSSLADSLGCHVNDLYAVAYSECGLDPFCIRKDGRAAGLIQFTPIGLHGLGVSLAGVKAMCKERDAVSIMELSTKYLVRAAKGRQLSGIADVYLAVFAPGHIGAEPDRVLYAGVGNPAYDLNRGLDGWHEDHSGRIVRSVSAMDGRITAGELYLYCVRKSLSI
jgi:hypothetical protein